jgi:FlaA1/EpsC-like NDP-sugar epimerase
MSNGYRDIWLERTCQLAAVGLSLTGAFLLRFDFAVPPALTPVLKQALLIAILVKLPVFDWVGFYRALPRFVSIPDLYLVFVGNIGGSALLAVAATFWISPAMPRSILLMDGILCFGATALVCFSARIFDEALFRSGPRQERTGILIYGAGAAGAELVREIHSNRCTRYRVVGFIDDDPKKQGAILHGVPVLGTGREASAVVHELNRRKPVVEEIIIAMRSATGRQMRETLANCRAARIPCKTLPGIDELLSSNLLAAQVRNVSVEDLLGRPPVKMDEERVRNSITGRSVLITGAAGSIGSELCRQIARLEPAHLVVFDQAESDLFRIEGELREKHPGLELVTQLGDIRDPDRLAEVLERQSIESVFHAAAYKHVPMMESHALEAVRNNVLGTWNLVRLAQRHRVDRLLMISSDKAVNPICVMGATKRVCERIVSAQSPKGITRCASVRFGNVLASNGSVVPIFQSQIAAGGPVRVTHPQARRYFMTISEAVSLTLQASSRSEGSEIFVLDMGEPIRIVELAENMIRLAGRVPYEDIEIQFTGLRPGEKLIEELNGTIEGMLPTDHEKMRVICEDPLSWDLIAAWVAELEELLGLRQEEAILSHLQALVPEYTPAARPATRSNGALRGATLDIYDKPWPVNGNGTGHHEKNGKPGPPVSTADPAPAIHVRE